MAENEASSEQAKTSDAPEESSKRRRTPLRRALRTVLEIGFFLLLFFVATSWVTRDLLSSGQTAPAFALQDLDGNTVQLSDTAGKTTLLHFWATWCGVCRREFSSLNALYQNLDDDEALITIVDDSEAEEMRAFVREHELEYPVLLGTPKVRDAYRVKAFPTNYFIDPKGKLKSATVGMSTRWSMATRMHCAH